MTAAPHSPLVKKVAKALAKAAFPSRKWTDLADYEAAVYLADAQAALDACHAEEVREVLKAAHAHVQELRDARERGAISEHDGLGGTRSNRNVDVEVQLRALLAKLEGRS